MFRRIVNLVRGGEFPGTARSRVSSGLTAAGTTNADALALNADGDLHVVETAALNAGVKLPVPGGRGDTVVVYNRGANAMLVYPQAGGQINALTATTGGLSVAAGGRAILVCWNGKDWMAVLSA